MPTLILVLMTASLSVLMVSPFIGWQLAFIAKPIIDIGWSQEYFLFGFSPLEIAGAALPAILIVRMLLFSGDRPRRYPLGGVWLAYAVTVLMGAFMYALNKDYIGGISFLLRTLNGIVAFYSMAVFFADRARFRWLVISMLVAGLVPMLMGFYEAVTGNYWRLRLGSGDQVRITGLYHNSTNLRYYAYVTLTAIAIYWVYFCRRGLLMKILLAGYAVISAVVLFKVYSKAGFGTVVLAGLAWIIMGRRIAWPAFIAAFVLVANAMFNNVVFDEIGNTFGKEVRVFQGTENEDTGFGGRMIFWKKQWRDFQEQDGVNQLFGGGDEQGGRQARGGGHNDYIRALKQTGIIGTAVYVWLLLAVGIALLRSAMRRRTPLVIIALVVYGGWMIETIGFTPAVYTNFQWYAWGIIGIALMGVRDLDPVPVRRRRPADPGMDPVDGGGPEGAGALPARAGLSRSA